MMEQNSHNTDNTLILARAALAISSPVSSTASLLLL